MILTTDDEYMNFFAQQKREILLKQLKALRGKESFTNQQGKRITCKCDRNYNHRDSVSLIQFLRSIPDRISKQKNLVNWKIFSNLKLEETIFLYQFNCGEILLGWKSSNFTPRLLRSCNLILLMVFGVQLIQNFEEKK